MSTVSSPPEVTTTKLYSIPTDNDSSSYLYLINTKQSTSSSTFSVLMSRLQEEWSVSNYQELIDMFEYTMHRKLSEVSSNNVKIIFKNAVEFDITKDGDYYCAEIPEYNIYEASITIDELLKSIGEEFVFLWDSYACEDDDNLTKDAIELKYNLLHNAEKVL